MWSWSYWLDASERVAVGFAAGTLGALGDLDGFNVFTADWSHDLGIGLGAAVVALLTSLTGSQVGVKGTASLLPVAKSQPAGKHEA